MSYLVLARKYRPTVFGEVVAQEHVTRTLVNALAAERISHSYLFSGPRGVGKTTTARLLARAVNCTGSQGTDPCNECDSCRAILAGNSMDVLEIDGASNRGIDEIRDLRERVGYVPSSSRYKVYIIDEVHMLTTEAFNALLKTLEEPPSHVIFMFATTAPHKIPPTILSRCQRFDFKAVPTADIAGQLEKVFEAEDVKMDREVVEMVARKAEGAMRDALSLADQVIAFCDGDYTVEKASQVLGVLDTGLFLRLSGLIEARDTLGAVEFADELAGNGVDLEEFYAELARHYRNLIIFRLGVKDPSAVDIPGSQVNAYRGCAQKFALEDLVRSLQLILQFEEIFKFSGQQKISLELLLVRLTMLDKSINISDLLTRLDSGAQPAAAAGELKKKSGTLTEPPRTTGSPPSGGPRLTAQPSGPPSPGPPGEQEEAPRLEEVKLDGPVDLEAIQSNWSAVVARIRRGKQTLAAQIGEASAVSFEGNTLKLEVPAKGYSATRLKDRQTRRLIADCVRDTFGLDSVAVEIETVRPATDLAGDKKDTQENPSAGSFEQLCRTNPLMGKIKELFDPELLDQ
ncbi:MAG: DNA polymerase III subunit gamma/tau [Candidatus Glassbacteria bacterium]|nr:DNA polymerase III subunit gamma/tau [Candidatus Glassbacteria bacterium]